MTVVENLAPVFLIRGKQMQPAKGVLTIPGVAKIDYSKNDE